MNLRHKLLVTAAVATALTAGGTAVAATQVRGHRTGSGPLSAHAAAMRVTERSSSKGFLAVVGRGRFVPQHMSFDARRLDLVTIALDGTRRSVYHTLVGRQGRGSFTLVDQSNDGRTALLRRTMTDRVVTAVDTASGAARTVRLPHPEAAVVLLPDGSGLLELGYASEGTSRQPVYRVGWDGSSVTVPTTVRGSVALTDAGRLLVPGSGRLRHTLRVVDLATGRPMATYATGNRHCEPIRAGDRGTIVLTCTARGAYTTVDLLHPRTGRVTPISRPHHDDGVHPFLGDLDARRLRSGTFVEEAGPCGVVYLTRQAPDGTLREIRPPHTVGNILLVGAQGGLPVIQHDLDCEANDPRSVLATYDPSTRMEHPIVALPAGRQLFTVLPLGERRATSW